MRIDVAASDIPNVQGQQPGESALSVRDLMLSIGFALMLAWHYIVLFSPIIDCKQDLDVERYGFYRQLVLYISLAVTFIIIGIVSNAHSRQFGHLKPRAATIYFGGVLAFGASAFCAIAPEENLLMMLVGIALLGMSEAFLMFLWLNRFLTVHHDSLLHPFSLDMIAGGAMAMVICMFQWPESAAVAVALPALSTAILAYDLKRSREGQDEDDKAASGAEADEATASDEEADGGPAPEEPEASRPDQETLSPISRKMFNRPQYMILSAGIYALSFGLMQGSFLRSGVALLITNNPLVMAGIIIAGVIIYQIPETLGHGVSVDLMHRFSLALFVLGAIGSAWFHLGEAFMIVSQIAVLAGFNLFDFGVMTYGMHRRIGQSQPVRVLEGGRPIVYIALTAGLAAGYYTLHLVPAPSTPFALVMICGASIFLIASTTILPFYSIDTRIAARQGNGDKDGESEEEPANMLELLASVSSNEWDARQTGKDIMQDEGWISPWRNSCNQIAKLYQLSPRETEIFLLIAKGRNAEHVQQKLVISTHTAKTHIANIYRKLEVHSQQELLDLIEAFRDADRRLAENDDEQE